MGTYPSSHSSGVLCLVKRLDWKTAPTCLGTTHGIHRYFEEDENGCSAYVPDLPGCIAAGDTIEEVRTLIAEAIKFHIESLREDGEVVPLPKDRRA